MSEKLAPHQVIALNEYQASCQAFALVKTGDTESRKAAKRRVDAATKAVNKAFARNRSEATRRMYEISRDALRSAVAS